MTIRDSEYYRLELEPFRFDPRNGDAVAAERGSLTVPENRRRPGSKAITLSFVRFRAAADNPGDPVVFLAGGPGESGIEFARGSHFPFFEALRESRDVIALDQRGAGASRPLLRCDSEAGALPPVRPVGREAFLDAALSRSRECAGRLRDSGIDLEGYDTNESADDLEDLRAALGADKLHLWGMSYGTHLAFAALKRHGARIGRCLFGGAEGPDHTYKLPSYIQRQLEHVGALVEADPAWKNRGGNFIETVAAILDRSDRFDVEYATAAGLADTRLLSLLPRWYDAMSRGDFSLPSREPLLSKYLSLAGRGFGANAMGILMDCASGATDKRWKRIEREAAQCVLGRTIDSPFPEIGEAWGCPDLGDEFRSPVRADNSVLFLSGSLDCRTPLENVCEVREGLPNSEVITVEGAGHMDVFLSCPGFSQIAAGFFAGGKAEVRTHEATRPFRLAPPE